MDATTAKLALLPEDDKAEILAIYVEEGLMDGVEAGVLTQKLLAQKMAKEFHNIPIAMTVFEGKVYGAYIGNMQPYTLKHDPSSATLAIELGLFNNTLPGKIDGKDVTWYRNIN
jgi:hypothetical protein